MIKQIGKFGLAFMILSYVLVIILFMHALFNPIHTVVIRINAFGEMIIETIALLISFVAVPMFLYDLIREGVIKPFGCDKWMKK